MSIESMTGLLAHGMTQQLDKTISDLMDAHCPGWVMEDVARRCKFVRVAGSPVETLYFDDTPILELHPIETEIVRHAGSWTYRVSRKYRRF